MKDGDFLFSQEQKVNSQKQILELIRSISGQANVLTIPRMYVEKLKSHRAALFLSQCVYWSNKTSDPDGWFYKTYAEWLDELGLPQHAVETCRRLLVSKNIIEFEIRRKSGTNVGYWRVKFDSLVELLIGTPLEDSHEEDTDLAEPAISDLAEPAISDLSFSAIPTIAETTHRLHTPIFFSGESDLDLKKEKDIKPVKSVEDLPPQRVVLPNKKSKFPCPICSTGEEQPPDLVNRRCIYCGVRIDFEIAGVKIKQEYLPRTPAAESLRRLSEKLSPWKRWFKFGSESERARWEDYEKKYTPAGMKGWIEWVLLDTEKRRIVSRDYVLVICNGLDKRGPIGEDTGARNTQGSVDLNMDEEKKRRLMAELDLD